MHSLKGAHKRLCDSFMHENRCKYGNHVFKETQEFLLHYIISDSFQTSPYLTTTLLVLAYFSLQSFCFDVFLLHNSILFCLLIIIAGFSHRALLVATDIKDTA